MTHDELSRQLEGLWHDSYKAPGYMALRAVVELHKPYIPMDNETGDYSVLAYCNCSKAFNKRDVITYPCATIQAIEKELA
ncbi:MAG: hypothetical protein EBU08_18560 [Micrococcales bacterium]|nr:hypothetical protein [Micrococcales bacterium]